ncbi:MAG: GMC oxidoreductase, partial [Gemmatimonadota bacterium]|nr:GMC oxidoreductase [Gemmatimonadota bacterium]
ARVSYGAKCLEIDQGPLPVVEIQQLYDVIIAGSGAAGTAAALQLAGRNVLVLDVGFRALSAGDRLDSNLYELKKEPESYFDELIGSRYESLHNIDHTYLMPKLKAPLMRFVTREAETLCPIRQRDFFAIASFAMGGLANVWGAQLYRFNDDELVKFPFGYSDLEPYYDLLTRHIGISGAADDLARFFGPADELLPPVKTGPLCENLYRRYKNNRSYFNRRGFYIGLPRLAVLTREYRGRPKYEYDNLEFFKPGNRAIYSPAYTLEELIAGGKIQYLPNYLVRRYEDSAGHAAVVAENLNTGKTERFEAKRVILALGPLNTAKLVLASNNDFHTRLPFLDNLISYVPLLDFRMIGAKYNTRCLATQLSMIYHSGLPADKPVMCTFYTVAGVFHSDILFNLPLSVRGNILAAKYLFPALAIVQLWYPDKHEKANNISLSFTGELDIRYRDKKRGGIERRIISAFRRFGYLGHASLCDYPLPGNSFHYAGTLPMNAGSGEKYTTRSDGLLSGTANIYIADASCFPSLPSKNLTMTTMANAMRIADKIGRSLEG